MVGGRRPGASRMVKAIRPIPPAVRDKQASASNPGASSFVSANAGSGKTHVLVQRVIRLLLTGVAPEKILCITFTKAAAANMAERVFTTLGHWVTLDDDALDAAIRSTANAKPDAALRARARRLFALALETPGGLKVQTIHAFCTRLLQQFPFEANVAARFAVLEETERKQLLERLSLEVLLLGAREPESPLGRALATAISSAADRTFREVVNEAIVEQPRARCQHVDAWVVLVQDHRARQMNQRVDRRQRSEFFRRPRPFGAADKECLNAADRALAVPILLQAVGDRKILVH